MVDVVNLGVTLEMQSAGREIASNLMDAQIAKQMNGLGGGTTWEQWLTQPIKNKDLIIAYLNDEIDSVTAIYIAMYRQRN